METVVATTDAEIIHQPVTEIETPQGTVSVVQVLPGQGIQHVQVIGSDVEGHLTEEDSESRKRREILARRPSYRRILNELSSTDAQPTITVAKIEEESDSNSDSIEDGPSHLTVGGVPIQAANILQPASLKVLPAQTIQIASHGDGTQGLQTLTMTNVSGSNAVSPTQGATIVQYAQAADGQFLIPVSNFSAGNVQYQIAGTTASLPQGVVMATTGGTMSTGISHNLSEEAARKRELRLLKNRVAASECRRKKKEYVKCLENRVAVLENQNKTLIQELKSLKELYCMKDEQG